MLTAACPCSPDMRRPSRCLHPGVEIHNAGRTFSGHERIGAGIQLTPRQMSTVIVPSARTTSRRKETPATKTTLCGALPACRQISASTLLITLYRLVRRWLGSLQLTVLLPLFAALLLLAMWATVLYQIERERSTAFKQAADTSDALAQTFEVRSTLVLQQVSQVTEFIKFEFEQHGAKQRVAGTDYQRHFPRNDRQPDYGCRGRRQHHRQQPRYDR